MPESETKKKKKTTRKKKTEKLVRVTLVKSPIGYNISQKRTVKGPRAA